MTADHVQLRRALSASAIGSLSISSEIESGVLLTVVTRPVRRSRMLLGKWLGLAGLLAGYGGRLRGRVRGGRLGDRFRPEPGGLHRVPVHRGALLLTLTHPERSFWHGVGDQARPLVVPLQ
jgi:hypothetical protein